MGFYMLDMIVLCQCKYTHLIIFVRVYVLCVSVVTCVPTYVYVLCVSVVTCVPAYVYVLCVYVV